jgi:DNA-binding XRE family transcriptional regulator
MVTHAERMARLPKARREKIEKRTDELHQEYKILRDLRERLDLTQGEMAQKIGVKQPAISKLESGERKLTFETFSKVITALVVRHNDFDRLGLTRGHGDAETRR